MILQVSDSDAMIYVPSGNSDILNDILPSESVLNVLSVLPLESIKRTMISTFAPEIQTMYSSRVMLALFSAIILTASSIVFSSNVNLETFNSS